MQQNNAKRSKHYEFAELQSMGYVDALSLDYCHAVIAANSAEKGSNIKRELHNLDVPYYGSNSVWLVGINTKPFCITK